jgi:hypothetical protein
MVIYTPSGYDLREDFEAVDRLKFDSQDRTTKCSVELLERCSSNDEEYLKSRMDISGPDKDYISASKSGDYSTIYGNAQIWQVEYDNYLETYAFIDVDSDSEGMLCIDIRQPYHDGPISKDDALLEMQNILNDMLH